MSDTCTILLRCILERFECLPWLLARRTTRVADDEHSPRLLAAMERLVFPAPASPRSRQLSPLDANALGSPRHSTSKRTLSLDAIDVDEEPDLSHATEQQHEDEEEENRPLLHGALFLQSV